MPKCVMPVPASTTKDEAAPSSMPEVVGVAASASWEMVAGTNALRNSSAADKRAFRALDLVLNTLKRFLFVDCKK